MSVRGRTGAQWQSHFNALKARNKVDSQILHAIAHPYGDEDGEEENGEEKGLTTKEDEEHQPAPSEDTNITENDENSSPVAVAPSERAVVRVKQENERRYDAASATSKGKKRRSATVSGKKRKAKKRKAPAPTPKSDASR